MRSLIYSILLLSIVFSSSCKKEQCIETHTYPGLVPVYMPYSEFRNAVESTTPKDLEKPGKIYYHGNFIFINETDKGIHIYDNSNPAAPQAVSFINIPGNFDMAVKKNILYADSYIDLLAIDISNPLSVKVVKRLEHIFPFNTKGLVSVDTTKGVVIDSKEGTVVQERPCNGGGGWGPRGFATDDGSNLNHFSQGFETPNTSGKGGSMARLTIMQGFLYMVDHRDMHLFSIQSESNPVFTKKIEVGMEIETIFPYKDNLFIGSTTGMHIYDNSNPANPVKLSVYQHVRNCDPVVVQDDIAYVTIRSGTGCGGFMNQLDVVDISNLREPKQIINYQMTNPHGLSINGNVLFLCDGKDGLKIFDASSPLEIDQNLKIHKTGYETFDVIALSNLAMVIGPDGFQQYWYNQNFEIQELGKIPVKGN